MARYAREEHRHCSGTGRCESARHPLVPSIEPHEPFRRRVRLERTVVRGGWSTVSRRSRLLWTEIRQVNYHRGSIVRDEREFASEFVDAPLQLPESEPTTVL